MPWERGDSVFGLLMGGGAPDVGIPLGRERAAGAAVRASAGEKGDKNDKKRARQRARRC